MNRPTIIAAKNEQLVQATYLFACIIHSTKDDSVVIRSSFFTDGRRGEEEIDMLSYADEYRTFDYMILTNWMIFPT